MLRGKRLVGLFALLALGLLLVNVKPAWAVTITPNPAVAGQPITFSGSSADVGGNIFSGFGCTGSIVAFVSTGGPGAYSFTLTGGLPAGSYSVQIIDDITPPTGCVNFTVQPVSIPEYPLGLPILAILMIVGYGLVRRRNRSVYP